MQPCPVGKVQLRKLTLSQPCMSMRLSLVFLSCVFKGARIGLIPCGEDDSLTSVRHQEKEDVLHVGLSNIKGI